MSPSIDSFAILINGLFFLVLVRLANDRDVVPSVTAFSASVGAFAYLNKLSYIYIALALSVTGILNLAFRKSSWTRGGLLCILFVVTFLLVVITVGFTIIGREGFHDLIEFHKHVFRGSGIYGTGDEVVVSGEEVWRAIAAIPADKAYAMFIALLGGAFLFVGGFATGLRGSQYAPVAIIGIGAGLASAFSAIIVLKHYKLHYTAGVSATLPSSLVAGYLLIKSWGYRPRITWAALAAVAILFMAAQTMPSLISELALRTKRSELAKADKEDIRAHLAGNRRLVEFVYRAPFAEYGEGFVVTYGSVPRLTDAYLQNRANAISSVTTGLIDREVGIYVLDKNYFPTADSVRTAPNIALLAPKTVTMEDGDKLIELRTTFLLIRR